MHIAKNLASAIGALTLAEGIESGHELGMVQEFGISLAQGFYLCRPQPAQYFVNHDGVCRPSPLVRNELLP
jgi:EAL domain-containing protein (putative c-di-GMP-specific phosphodiesterase class I)